LRILDLLNEKISPVSDRIEEAASRMEDVLEELKTGK